MLGWRGGRLGLGGCLGSNRGDLRDRNGAALVAPGVHRVRQRVGNLLVRQLRHRRHHGVVLDPVHHDLALEAAHDDADRAVLVAQQVIGSGQRREGARQALAVGLVAGQADRLVDAFTGLHLRCNASSTGHFGLMHLRCARAGGRLSGPGGRGECKGPGDRERYRRRRAKLGNELHGWLPWFGKVRWRIAPSPTLAATLGAGRRLRLDLRQLRRRGAGVTASVAVRATRDRGAGADLSRLSLNPRDFTADGRLCAVRGFTGGHCHAKLCSNHREAIAIAQLGSRRRDSQLGSSLSEQSSRGSRERGPASSARSCELKPSRRHQILLGHL
jgi:hypothetical protein